MGFVVFDDTGRQALSAAARGRGERGASSLSEAEEAEAEDEAVGWARLARFELVGGGSAARGADVSIVRSGTAGIGLDGRSWCGDNPFRRIRPQPEMRMYV
jgi:hypothetical protein